MLRHRLQTASKAQVRAALRRRLPRLIPPIAIESAYLVSVKGLISPAQQLIKDQLLPRLGELASDAGVRSDSRVRQDAYGDKVASIMATVRLQYEQRIPAKRIESVAKDAADKTDQHNRDQQNKQVRSVLGFDVFGPDPKIATRAQAFTRENVSLIKSIPDRYFSEVEQLVIRNFRAGVRAEQVADEIGDRFNVSESRAAVIARDQVGKLNGELTQDRQTGLGISGYTWRTMLDQRVRPSHQDLEGRHFDWVGGDQPPEGKPGQPVLCRCYGEPDVGELLDSLDL